MSVVFSGERLSMGQRRKSIVAACLGMTLESYDGMLFAHLLIVLTPLFFKVTDPLYSAILGYLSILIVKTGRIIGGFLFARITDKFGRVHMMMFTIGLAIVPTAIMAVCPTYLEVGIIGTVVMLSARLVQTIAVGGDCAMVPVLCLEHADTKKLFLYGAMPNIAYTFGMLLSALFSYLSIKHLPESWGWRFPFIISVMMGLSTVFIRSGLKETETFFGGEKAE